MPWWAWVLIGLVAGVPCWRATFRWATEEEPVNDGAYLATLVGITTFLFVGMGPCLLLRACVMMLWARRDAEPVARALGGESRDQKRRRREREFAAREAAIRQAERELGIGGDE